MSSARSTDHLAIGYPQSATAQQSSDSPTASPPIDPPSGGSIRSPFGLPPGLISQNKMSGASRSGAGSPSHDMTASGLQSAPSRLYSKRAREIQAQEGIASLPVNPWAGPPTSGNSTPLRENIPESPTDGFPDLVQMSIPDNLPQTRRARGNTVPSRFPGGPSSILGSVALPSNTSRPAPSHSPFKSPSPGLTSEDSAANSSNLLSRLRAGSLPQRSPFVAPNHIPGSSSPFGPGIFSSWPTGRERGATLASIASVGSNGLSSPAQSHYSREGNGETDVHMRTLDYLGLAETPQPQRAQLATLYQPTLADLTNPANRFRSYSVNNTERYDEEGDAYRDTYAEAERLGQIQQQQIARELAVTHAMIQQHNLHVQVLASQTGSRPRARTAGVLDTPVTQRLLRGTGYYPTPSRLDNSITAAEVRLSEEDEMPQTVAAVAAMTLGRSSPRNNGLLSAEEQGMEGPTSALWLGSIPTSTTTSTLTEMFKSYGPISSARVLTHKNCGFVNFERLDSAIAAKSALNGKEIFPGAGAIRINFAKPPSASNTPGHDGAFPSPSPDPFARGQEGQSGTNGVGTIGEPAPTPLATNVAPTVPPLREMVPGILDIVKEFGASDEEKFRISQSLNKAVQFTEFIDEIPPIKEPAHTRVHDAPKLRDIRKRIDNQTLTQAEIENIAVDMLPEIAELSSDYLGNTVVQKLFEHCSDDLRDSMLAEIAPHMAEIGVHKNGTWAAQKIIEVCSTPRQMQLIVDNIRPYTVPLFLDQYGNYVLQGCLKFGSSFNDFIFEMMLSRMWEVAQGRYGARAMRACLESHHATKDQQRMLAGGIALHSVQLTTNTNSALLLTWFLDTCNFPNRRTILSPHLVPYLVHMCTHKVAYLTVLKVINQKNEPEARDTIVNALFFSPNDQVLEAILSDQSSGATFIFKVITTPFFDDSIRSQVLETIKAVLVRLRAHGNSGYKRLMDEVGLSTRNGGGGGGSREHGSSSTDRQRPDSRHRSANGQHQNQQGHQGGQQKRESQQQLQQAQQQVQQAQFAQNNGGFYATDNSGATVNAYQLGYGLQRSDSVEPPLLPQLAQQFQAYGVQGSPYNGANPAMAPAAMPQFPYAQNMMSRPAPGMNNFAFPALQAGFGGFNNATQPIDFRSQNLVNGSPIQQPGNPQMPGMSAANQGPFAAPGFGVPMGMNGFGYAGMNMNGMQQNVPYMQEQSNGRRGRR